MNVHTVRFAVVVLLPYRRQYDCCRFDDLDQFACTACLIERSKKKKHKIVNSKTKSKKKKKENAVVLRRYDVCLVISFFAVFHRHLQCFLRVFASFHTLEKAFHFYRQIQKPNVTKPRPTNVAPCQCIRNEFAVGQKRKKENNVDRIAWLIIFSPSRKKKNEERVKMYANGKKWDRKWMSTHSANTYRHTYEP